MEKNKSTLSKNNFSIIREFPIEDKDLEKYKI
jgi:hypothetical protein